MQKNTIGCDIFCDVIDNFGDAGVCWRLARDIRKEKGWNVRFYINNLETLSAIEPRVDSEKVRQHAAGIELLKWEYAERESPSDIVIETFGCRIPDPFEKRIAERNPSPIWINLEYLSAEDWVEGCHTLPSPHPRYGTKKYFFFPGVTNKTGGIICETGLNEHRQLFKSKKEVFLKTIGANPESPFNTFVFCYPSAPLKILVEALASDRIPIQLLLAAGGAGKEIQELAKPYPHILCVPLPMLPQTDFDKLLWVADSLIIRGEDSFARAQLAGKPFIWNIYPQTEDTHIHKLTAFEDRLKPFYSQKNFELLKEINLAFNKGDSSFIELWRQWRDATSELTESAAAWEENLHSVGSLTENLCKFIESKLKS
ncbi:elongation factor P maturation arginine rhamnosyltransferase EarP [Turicimonas muris]|uniref:elongation factor P maturation arginine rhamnosyltransferase EarP n=9 Tax=Turicimonas muris TaxID=1796652 RepID=UPI0023EF7311|nr:elongation factor P maturation arginine rhamnosyltransferase EarP [Turicimonas muris]